MSWWDTLLSWFVFLLSEPTIAVVLSVTTASSIIIAIVLLKDRELEQRIRDVTENRYFTLTLKTYYIGYDAIQDTLKVSLLTTKNRKRINIDVLKFFSQTASFGKEFVISALQIRMTDSIIEFSEGNELQEIIEEVGKWCDRIVQTKIRSVDSPKELDQAPELSKWPC